jgi:hypothetical protein
VIILSPWLNALSLLSKDLLVSGTLRGPLRYGGVIDEWWVRLFPLPLDVRSLFDGVGPPTPYLDAQINLPLLLACLFVAFWTKAHHRKIFWFLLSAFLFLFLVSVGLIPTHVASSIFNKIQLLYRLVTFQNIILMCLFVFLAPQLSRLNSSNSSKFRVLLTVLLTMSAMAVLERLVHAYPIQLEGKKFGYSEFLVEEDFLHLPKSLYGEYDYIALKYFRKNESATDPKLTDKNFELGSGADFGNVKPIQLGPKDLGWYHSNVHAFPWNKIYYNEKEESEPVSAWYKLVFSHTTPSQKIASYKFVPDPKWEILRVVGGSVFILFLFMGAFVFYRLKNEVFFEPE